MNEDRLAALEARVQELEDVRQITDAARKFNWECCGGFNGVQAGRMEALDNLADDATIEVKGLHEPGKGPKGREQYTEYWDYFYGDAGPLPYVFQAAVSEFVEVTGDTAESWCVMIGLFGFRGGSSANFNLATRRNYYKRTDKGWKITKTTIDGGLGFKVPELEGGQHTLNELPPTDDRKPWTWEAQQAKDAAKAGS